MCRLGDSPIHQAFGATIRRLGGGAAGSNVPAYAVDCANLPAVVHAAGQETRIGLVLADAEFDSESNHAFVRQRLKGQSLSLPGLRAENALPQRTRAVPCVVQAGNFVTA